VHARKRIPHELYADAVIAELESRRGLFPGRAAATLYFGGGTPGLWRADSLGSVLDCVRRAYALAADAEVTVEVNPGELDEEHLASLRARGVNRLSIGAQSFDDRSLRFLGREHDAASSRASVGLARRAGFQDVSVDLMFGLPRMSLAALERELDALLALDADHLSLYGLTIEPRTAFAALVRAGELALPAPEHQAELYERVVERLAKAGYAQHEISSFARAGHHARHNTLYWTQDEYLGVGCSAHSLRLAREDGMGERVLWGERFANLRSVDAWLDAGRKAPAQLRELSEDPRLAERERLDGPALLREALWLGLRMARGLERARFLGRFGRDPLDAHAAFLRLMAAGLVEHDAAHVRLTARGRLLADEVGAALV
jgi:oxygen-independent coproporphyrinogen-3 oxidase